MLPVSESARTRVRDAIERVWTSNQQGVASLSMAWVEYEAELDRYGGEVAIPATERLFDSSSCFALVAVTPEVSANRSSRLGRAILATLTALHTLIGTCGGVCAFARTYTDSYLLAQQMDEAQRRATIRSFDVHAGSDLDPMREYLEYAWEQLELGEPLSPALDNYREALVQYRRDIEALLPTGCVAVRGRTLTDWAVAGPRLGSSIVHMTNNRLGVAIPEEAYVAHLIHRVFDAAER
jgi:thiopeptide-type bacteriocin biosynthesis protein